MKSRKTKLVALTAVFAALYVVLSVLLKIPVAGHITLDLGYIALMVGAVYLGTLPGALIGGIGALIESSIMSQHGISPGWICMNLIAGAACGYVLHSRFRTAGKKKFVILALITVLVSMFVGVVVKTAFDCMIYRYPLAVKIPTSLTAWLLDSAVMLAIGLPVCFALKNKVKL